jgi:hypothetical protein
MLRCSARSNFGPVDFGIADRRALLVNFNLKLVSLAEPERPWRIITSDNHSTVWDGKRTLFDLNFLALGVSPRESFELAHGRELPLGRLLKVYYAKHYSEED